jgi:predicted  nucleic acid-binding Zn-ribbon protein
MEISEYERRLTETEQRSKSNSHRLDAVEKRQDDLDALVGAVAEVRKDQEYVREDVKEIKADVKTLTEKPGKRWDGIVDKLIWALLAAIIGFAAAYVGLT